jgi:hypothetical protein
MTKEEEDNAGWARAVVLYLGVKCTKDQLDHITSAFRSVRHLGKEEGRKEAGKP